MDSHLEALYPASSREKEIKKIIAYIKEGNSCQIIAAPGVGRGNLLGFLAYNRAIRMYQLGEDYVSYHFVMVNFSEVKNRPLRDIIKFLFLELVTSLHARDREEEFAVADKNFKEGLGYNDELVLFQALKKTIDYLTLEKNLTVILLFERFETYIPRLTEDFFTYLRSLRNRAKYKFSVVFSLTRPLEETIEPTILADFYEFLAGHIVYLDLCDLPGILFRIDYLQQVTQEKISQENTTKLLEVTAGHGKLTRSGAEALLASEKTQEVTSHFLLGQKTIQGALSEIWEFFTPSEKDYLQKIAQKRDSSESFPFLNHIQIVKEGKITIPILEDFIDSSPKKQSSQISYDASTNTIKRGSTVISENLTAAEFRLLVFLIEHPDQIIDREAIIQAVWKNQETTFGVTDQALDQLIFRLRKQIEPNPNAPIYIQTIKGRGIKFSNE